MRQHFILLLTFIVSLSSAQAAFAATKKSHNDEALMIELTGKDPSKVNETTLYSEIVAAFRRNDEIGFKSRMQTFTTRFGNSPYADNVLYLAGKMALGNKNYAEAIKYFQKVIAQYPRSNKAVAARMAKGYAYKKMNLAPQARYVFQELKSKYPGSPEYFRAENELKILK